MCLFMKNEEQHTASIETISPWEDFLKCLPSDWRQTAERANMLKGLRQDKDPDKLMHVLMLHLLCGYSLRETSTIARASGLADMSDVAIMKRLQKSEEMFKELCAVMFGEVRSNEDTTDFHIRLIDGTDIKEPGQFGTLWRIHYSFSLPDMTCDYFKLTKTIGNGTGEGLEQFEVRPNDIMIADRGYSRFGCLKHVADGGGYSCVRWNSQAQPLFSLDGEKYDIKRFFMLLPREGMCKSDNVFIKDKKTHATLQVRLCAIRKSDESAAKARHLVYRIASKNQNGPPSELTLLACDYIVLITTLPQQFFTLKTVLELYRLRWQVELVFKRFKSLARLGALPKYKDESAKAWLYGKMFAALLIERISSRLGAFSPWRCESCARSTQKLLDRVCNVATYRDPVGDPTS